MMTIAACLWFGLFPLLNGGSYAHITKDKWWIMMILCGVTTLCFGADLVLRAVRQRHILPTSAKRSGFGASEKLSGGQFLAENGRQPWEQNSHPARNGRGERAEQCPSGAFAARRKRSE